ncbi:MAG: hypothetical protein GY698_14915 [Actinomycetia bacterium]|nr:hypothetical protein [Actinomycetes bacterium]
MEVPEHSVQPPPPPPLEAIAPSPRPAAPEAPAPAPDSDQGFRLPRSLEQTAPPPPATDDSDPFASLLAEVESLAAAATDRPQPPHYEPEASFPPRPAAETPVAAQAPGSGGLGLHPGPDVETTEFAAEPLTGSIPEETEPTLSADLARDFAAGVMAETPARDPEPERWDPPPGIAGFEPTEFPPTGFDQPEPEPEPEPTEFDHTGFDPTSFGIPQDQQSVAETWAHEIPSNLPGQIFARPGGFDEPADTGFTSEPAFGAADYGEPADVPPTFAAFAEVEPAYEPTGLGADASPIEGQFGLSLAPATDPAVPAPSLEESPVVREDLAPVDHTQASDAEPEKAHELEPETANPFDVLGLPHDASWKAVRIRRRDLIAQLDPSSIRTHEDARAMADRLGEINGAVDSLRETLYIAGPLLRPRTPEPQPTVAETVDPTPEPEPQPADPIETGRSAQPEQFDPGTPTESNEDYRQPDTGVFESMFPPSPGEETHPVGEDYVLVSAPVGEQAPTTSAEQNRPPEKSERIGFNHWFDL